MTTEIHLPRGFNRRTLLGGTAGGMTAVWLGGCSSSEESSSSSSTGPVKFLAGGGRWEKGDYGWTSLQEYSKKNPDEKVTVVSGGQDTLKTFTQAASTRNFPDLVLGGPALPVMLAHKWALSMEELGVDIKSKFPKEMWVDGVTTSGGKTYSWSQDDGRGIMLGYNTKYMDDIGASEPPATWDELIDMSVKMHAKNKDVFGMGMQLEAGKDGLVWIARTLQAATPGIDAGFDLRAGRYAMDTYYTPAMEVLLKMQQTNTLHPNSSQLNYAQLDGYWNAGRTMFNLDGSWLCSVAKHNKFEDFKVANPPVLEDGDKVGVYGSLAQGSYIAMTASKNRESLKGLVEYLVSEAWLKTELDNLSIPPVPDLAKKYASTGQLKEQLDVQYNTWIQPPLPQTDNLALEARKKEAELPAPTQTPSAITLGALSGRIKDWKSALKEMNQQYNDRFDKALDETKCPRSKFTFADWDGLTSYQTS
ncbi:MAG TPA: extracellular solute-binding protein [Microlunatus sp.]